MVLASVSHLYFGDRGLQKVLLLRVPGQDVGPDVKGHLALDVLIAERGAAEAVLEGDPHLDLLDHGVDLGLAEGALVLGGHVGADGQRGGGLTGLENIKTTRYFLKLF